MNEKITQRALTKLVRKQPHEPVSLSVRITTPLTQEQIEVLMAWGGKLSYDNGIMALVILPAGRVNDLATWETVIDII